MNTTGKADLESFASNGVFSLDQNYFPRPWKKTDWEALNPAHHILFTRGSDASLVGFALFALVPGDVTVHLLKISILPELRGSGEAKRFWSDILADFQNLGLQSVYLEVEGPNDRAIGFYQSVGFQKLRSIKNFYSDGTEAIIMSLTL